MGNPNRRVVPPKPVLPKPKPAPEPNKEPLPPPRPAACPGHCGVWNRHDQDKTWTVTDKDLPTIVHVKQKALNEAITNGNFAQARRIRRWLDHFYSWHGPYDDSALKQLPTIPPPPKRSFNPNNHNNQTNTETPQPDILRKYNLDQSGLYVSFDSQGQPLPENDVNECLNEFEQTVLTLIAQHGENSNISKTLFHLQCKDLRFDILKLVADHRLPSMRLKDTSRLFQAFRAIIPNGGYRAWQGNIFMAGPPEEKQIQNAVAILQPLDPPPPMVPGRGRTKPGFTGP
ncbi:MAG: hypothetical protein Q9221_000726 [Calogaya cf. arnoldii]